MELVHNLLHMTHMLGQNTLSQIYEFTKVVWAKQLIACGRIIVTIESTRTTCLCETTVIRNGNWQ